jgi:hypothetical protein
MLKAAQTDYFWQSYPFRCAITGLTLKIEGGNPVKMAMPGLPPSRE